MKKDRLRKEKMKFLAMNKPMYDNIRMLDPQGELLSQISVRKANWYVGKELADWVDASTCRTATETSPVDFDGNKFIQLRFEPKNRCSEGGRGSYIKSDKKNACVVCGDDEYIMRHYVVPYAYRTHFPHQYKSKLSHDIIVLCPLCQVTADQERQQRMQAIEDEYRGCEAEPKFIVDPDLYRLRNKALALLKWQHKIPAEKVKEYDDIVRRHLDLMDKAIDLTSEQLQSAIDVEYRIENPKYVPGAVVVAAYLGSDEEKITAFIRDWRRHFINTMDPQHLPVGWGVDSSVDSSV